MLYAIIALFALAAVAGLLILKNWLTAQNSSQLLVYGHGIVAAGGLILLIAYFLNHKTTNVQASLILFVVAAIGGFYMFFRDLKGKMSPVWFAVVHGLIAVGGFIFLLLLVI